MVTTIIETQTQPAEHVAIKREHIPEECPALMDDKNEKITTTDIFETKIGKLKSTANKIMKKLEKFNIITQQ